MDPWCLGYYSFENPSPVRSMSFSMVHDPSDTVSDAQIRRLAPYAINTTDYPRAVWGRGRGRVVEEVPWRWDRLLTGRRQKDASAPVIPQAQPPAVAVRR